MTAPLVTIIIVSYNHAHFIEECLDSILQQNYSTIELILADDASKDDSVQVYNNWLEKNNYQAKCVYNDVNIGLSATLNKSIKIATGKYIKLLAADDYLHTESISACVNFLENNSINYGMVFSDVFFINNDSEIIEDKVDYNKIGNLSPEEFNKYLIRGNRIAALSVLMKTSVLLETGEYDNSFIVEDYYRWLKIAQSYYIGYIPEKLAYYRLHETNISKLKQHLISEETILLQMKFDKFGVAKDVIDKAVYEVIANNLMSKRLKDAYLKYPYGKKKTRLYCKSKIAGMFVRLVYYFRL